MCYICTKVNGVCLPCDLYGCKNNFHISCANSGGKSGLINPMVGVGQSRYKLIEPYDMMVALSSDKKWIEDNKPKGSHTQVFKVGLFCHHHKDEGRKSILEKGYRATKLGVENVILEETIEENDASSESIEEECEDQVSSRHHRNI